MPRAQEPVVKSKAMAAVRRRDTNPEILLRQTLYSLGIRGWRLHREDLPGKPDLAFPKSRVAVFVDGALWHGHPDHAWKGKNKPVWNQKVARTIKRDQETNEILAKKGWNVVRLWDFEIEKDPVGAAQKVVEVLKDS